MIEIRRYKKDNNAEPVTEWLESIKDKQARARIEVRLARLTAGNFGDCKPLRDSVWELKIDWGCGYRVYYGQIGKAIVLLLCGGDKRTQDANIERAVDYFKDFKRRSK
ncbi:MAG: type II toxin-antitoxin system RelE/ParE family toxin [Sulfuricella sp.]